MRERWRERERKYLVIFLSYLRETILTVFSLGRLYTKAATSFIIEFQTSHAKQSFDGNVILFFISILKGFVSSK